MSKTLVTGGAGFLGSHLCDALLQEGHDVIALDNFDEFYHPAIKRRNLESASTSDRFTLVEGDIRDAHLVKSVIDEGVDVVVHLAARAGVRGSIEQPMLYQDVNVRGTLVLLEGCRARPNCKVIFASSSSVYGNRTKVPFAESDRVDDPISPYAATKRAGELLCYTYHHLYGMAITCLRFFTVYGPRQRPDLAIHRFTRLIAAGKPIPLFGDGSMLRDFTYVDDVVDGVRRAMERCGEYRIYNVGASQPITITHLVELLEETMGRKATIEYQPLQPGDVDRTYADVTLARRELGYHPSTDFKTGLRRFVEWFHADAAVR